MHWATECQLQQFNPSICFSLHSEVEMVWTKTFSFQQQQIVIQIDENANNEV